MYPNERNLGGRVLVSPKAPLGIDEFQRLYLGEGATPEKAASFIHMNYPTEAKSLLDERWKALGITESPAQYFSKAENIMPLEGPITGEVRRKMIRQLQPLQRERYAGPMPEMLGPQSRIASPPPQVAPLTRLDMQQRQLEVATQNLANAKTPEDTKKRTKDLYEVQTTYDPTGFVKGFLSRQQGVDPAKEILKPVATEDPNLFNAFNTGKRRELQPYLGQKGLGSRMNTNIPSRLDQEVYNDPEFQKLYINDPQRAAAAYSATVGRSLVEDLNADQELRKTQLETGRKYAAGQIASGATYDPGTGEWRVLNYRESESDQFALGRASNPITRDFVPATPEQNAWLNNHYTAITNRPLERYTVKDELVKMYDDPARNPYYTEWQQLLKDQEARQGMPLSLKSKAKMAADFDKAKAILSFEAPFLGRAAARADDSMNQIFGYDETKPKSAIKNLADEYIFSKGGILGPNPMNKQYNRQNP